MNARISVIFVLVAWAGSLDAAKFTLRNQCSMTVWPGTLTGGGAAEGWALQPGKSLELSRGAGWTGRFWSRTGCNFDQSGSGRCATGDCGGLNCQGGGVPPVTLAEFTIAGYDGMDFYDVSLVDGFNLPLSIRPSGGRGRCAKSSCGADVNAVCPPDLKVVEGGATVACKSACTAFGSAEYCCTAEHNTPQTCRPSHYAQVFKQACPSAYSYAYDDLTGTFTCTGADYTITFCP